MRTQRTSINKLFSGSALFAAMLILGSQTTHASELSCGEVQSLTSPYAHITFDSQNMNVDFQGFVGEASWFAINALKSHKLPLEYLNRQYAFVKVRFSTPLLTATNQIETRFDAAHSDIFTARASKTNGHYGTMPVLADVTFSMNTLDTVHYKMPLEFSGIERFGRSVTTTMPNNQSSTTDSFVELKLTKGNIIVHEACAGRL